MNYPPAVKASCWSSRACGSATGIEAKVALVRDNVASVSWRTAGGEKHVELRLERPARVRSVLPTLVLRSTTR